MSKIGPEQERTAGTPSGQEWLGSEQTLRAVFDNASDDYPYFVADGFSEDFLCDGRMHMYPGIVPSQLESE